MGLSAEEFRSYLSMIGPTFETAFAEQFGGDLDAAFAKLDTGDVLTLYLYLRLCLCVCVCVFVCLGFFVFCVMFDIFFFFCG